MTPGWGEGSTPVTYLRHPGNLLALERISSTNSEAHRSGTQYA
jgi:hypothetical protein